VILLGKFDQFYMITRQWHSFVLPKLPKKILLNSNLYKHCNWPNLVIYVTLTLTTYTGMKKL